MSETTHETGKRVEAAEVVEGLEVGLECGCDGDGVCGECEGGAGLEERRRRGGGGGGGKKEEERNERRCK